MEEIDFVKLPLPVQTIIVSHMSFIDLLLMALDSVYFRYLLFLVKRRMGWLKFNSTSKNEFRYFLHDDFKSTLEIQIHRTEEGMKDAEKEKHRSIVAAGSRYEIDGHSLIVSVERNSYGSGTIYIQDEEETSRSSWELIESFTRFIKKFLRPQETAISISTPEPDLSNIFSWNISKHFSKVVLGWLGESVISEEGLINLLENVRVDHLCLHHLKVANNLNYKYQYKGPTRVKPTIDAIWLNENDWVDFDNFFQNFNIPTVICTVPTFEVANSILLQWVNGNFNTTKSLALNMSGILIDIDEVLKGIQKSDTAYGYQLVKRDLPTFLFFLEPEGSFDIKRKHDGCLATIGIECDSVVMLVWDK